MRPLPVFLLVLFIIFSTMTTQAAPPTPKIIKIYLTKINATGAAGLTLQVVQNSVVLDDLAGDKATSFKIDPSTVEVKPTVSVKFVVKNRHRQYSSATQVWKITDKSGEGVEILDNTLRTLIVISQVDHAVSFDQDGQVYPVPGRSLVLINEPTTSATLDYGGSGWLGFTGHYREKMTPIDRPTEVVISPNDSGIKGGFPVIVEDTHCDQPTELGGG